MPPVDLDLGLGGTHVLITGGAGLIGRAVVSAFLSAGAKVSVLDSSAAAIRALEAHVASEASQYAAQPVHLWCDVADVSGGGGARPRGGAKDDDEDGAAFDAAFGRAAAVFGPVACCVALAALDLSVLPHHPDDGILGMTVSQWDRTMAVNVRGAFLTARAWLRRLKAHADNAAVASGSNAGSSSPATTGGNGVSASDRLRQLYLPNRSLILVGSESGMFGERGNADYAASKSAVQGGLLTSLRADVPRTSPGARVNAVAPGPVDTDRFREECSRDPAQFYADARATTALGRPVDVACVARSVVFLASEKFSGSVHGHVLRVDSGKEGKLMWTD